MTPRTSEAGLALIRRFEGLCDAPYRCPAGRWSVGYGWTGPVEVRGTGYPSVAAAVAAEGTGWRLEEAAAERLLRRGVRDYEAAVRRLVLVPLSQGEHDALVSFAYNLGEAALAASTLLAKLNDADRPGAAREFGRWVHAGGERLAGLVRRRAAERALFEAPGPRVFAPEEAGLRGAA